MYGQITLVFETHSYEAQKSTEIIVEKKHRIWRASDAFLYIYILYMIINFSILSLTTLVRYTSIIQSIQVLNHLPPGQDTFNPSHDIRFIHPVPLMVSHASLDARPDFMPCGLQSPISSPGLRVLPLKHQSSWGGNHFSCQSSTFMSYFNTHGKHLQSFTALSKVNPVLELFNRLKSIKWFCLLWGSDKTHYYRYWSALIIDPACPEYCNSRSTFIYHVYSRSVIFLLECALFLGICYLLLSCMIIFAWTNFVAQFGNWHASLAVYLLHLHYLCRGCIW